MKTQWQVKSYTSSLGETGDYFTEAWIENGELKLIASSDIESDEELHEIANALNSFESLDQQNKELMELAQREQQQRLESDSEFFKAQEEIQRLTKELELCQTGNSDLQMEVEELKRHNTEQASIKHDLRVEITELTKELTRLRELLGRAEKWIYDNASEESTANDERQKLLSEINALNPKP